MGDPNEATFTDAGTARGAPFGDDVYGVDERNEAVFPTVAAALRVDECCEAVFIPGAEKT